MNSMWIFNACLVALLLTWATPSTCQISHDPDELLNWCIDGKNHKERPGPEDKLHEQCIPWKERSCCTNNITVGVHTSNMYNFDWDHCSHKKPMSDVCRRHFVQDLCFYECEPNLGPWVVKVEMKIRNERAYGVPLCASDCQAWYNDCQHEYTCVDNWTRKFVWLNGNNTCPKNSTCRLYSEVFKGSAKTFCEKIWDHAWTYTDDDKPCMRLWFNGSLGNPNDRVAKAKVAEFYTSIQKQEPSASSKHLIYSHLFVFVIISGLLNFK